MTINERAKEFAQENAKDNNPHLVAHAYHCGAIDQQNIDIEKAIDIFCEEVCAFIKHESCDVNCPYVERIHKAMKGE